jgi:hypothetical protein
MSGPKKSCATQVAALKSKAKRIKQTILFLICRPDYNHSPAPPPWPPRLDGACAVHQNPNPRQRRQRLAGHDHTVHSINSSPVGHVEIQVNFPLERRSSFPLFGKKGVRGDFDRASFSSTCMPGSFDHKRAASGTPPACTSKTARPPEKFGSLCSRARRPSSQPCGHRRFRSD